MHAGRALVDHLSLLRAPNGTGIENRAACRFRVSFCSGEETRAWTATCSGQVDAGWSAGALNVRVSA